MNDDKPKIEPIEGFDDDPDAVHSPKTGGAPDRDAITKTLMKIICICKGINLARVLKGLEGSDTVADVNAKTGCGSGGCQGERCGPRIKILLRKKKGL